MDMENIEELVLKYNILSTENSMTVYEEVKRTIDALVYVTSETYNQRTLDYAKLRNDKPSSETVAEMQKMIQLARIEAENNNCIEILDAGAGHGRDLLYLNALKNINVIGVDNSANFFYLLKQYEMEGMLPLNSCYMADIRNMSVFCDKQFDIVRFNASILHLPITCFDDLGANAVFLEAYRILKNNGVIYIRVKEGEGFKVMDNGDGLGKRCFQFYTVNTLHVMLEKYGFKDITIERRSGAKHRKDKVVWLSAYARRG